MKGWSSFPAAHKKKFYQGLAAYLLVSAATAGWIVLRSHTTVEDWNARMPSATVAVKNVYLTPQITGAENDVTGMDSGNFTTPAAPSVDDGKTYISIIVSGLGLSSLATERALDDLPPQVTLAFSPYGNNVRDWIQKAVAARHESLLLLPMEAAKYPAEDPGPKALTSRYSDADNNDNLAAMLKQGEGSVGVMNLMGSRFLADAKRLTPVFTALRQNNAMFIQTPGIERSAAPDLSTKLGMPYMSANLEVDSIATDKAIRDQLGKLERIARDKGYAIGIAQPYPLTMNVIKSWAADLEKRGITLAPLRTIYKNKPRYAP